MPCRASALLLAALLTSAAGCRSSSCGNQQGLSASHNRNDPNCTLVGSGGRPPMLAEGCYDGITGQPIPCPPSATVIPGGTAPPPIGGRPDELPFPAPSDLIPRTGVPLAPPSAAPGVGAISPGGATKTSTKQ